MTRYDAPEHYNDPGILYGGTIQEPEVVPGTSNPFVPQLTVPLKPEVQINIPFGVDATGGIGFVSTPPEIDRINLITLVGTQPGERAMRPIYGVATRDLLFELNNPALAEGISRDVLNQAELYAPEIRVDAAAVEPDRNNPNQANIAIRYRPAPQRLDTTSATLSTSVIATGGTLNGR